MALLIPTASNAAQIDPQLYEFCRQAGFLLAEDSPALARNWRPGGELEEPPWYDIDRNEIGYIGACPPMDVEPSLPPATPGEIQVDSEVPIDE